jgi:hypothetical protein
MARRHFRLRLGQHADALEVLALDLLLFARALS